MIAGAMTMVMKGGSDAEVFEIMDDDDDDEDEQVRMVMMMSAKEEAR